MKTNHPIKFSDSSNWAQIFKIIKKWSRPFFVFFLRLMKLFNYQFLLKNWKKWSDSDHFFWTYFFLNICAQFELSKNSIGWVFFKSPAITVIGISCHGCPPSGLYQYFELLSDVKILLSTTPSKIILMFMNKAFGT